MRRQVIVVLVIVLITWPALACETGPTPTPTASPALTETPAPVEPTDTPTVPPPTSSPAPVPTPAAGPIDLGVPAGDAYDPRAMAVDDARGLVYVVSGYGDAANPQNESVLSVVDVAQGKVQATAALPHPFWGSASMALAPAGDRLFIAGGNDNVLLVVAAGIGSEPLGEILSVQSDVRAAALEPASLRLYTVGTDQIRVLDANSLEMLQQAEVPAGLPTPPAYVFIAVSEQASRLYVGSPAREIITVYRTDNLQKVADILPGGQLRDLTAKPDGPQVYLKLGGQPDGYDRVAVIEGARVVQVWQPQNGFRLEEVVPGDVPDRVYLRESGGEGEPRLRAVNPVSGQTMATMPLPTGRVNQAAIRAGRLYLLSWNNLLIALAVDNSAAERTVRLGVTLRSAAIDQSTGRLFVIDSAGTIHALDTATLRRIDSWPQVIGTQTGNVSWSSLSVADGHLYVPDFDADETVVLDVASGQRGATIPKAGQVILDPARRRLFVIQQGVFIVDPETYTVVDSIDETVRKTLFSGEPSAIAAQYDAAHDLLLVTMSNNVPGSSASTWLHIYDGETLQRLDTDIQTDQKFLAGLTIDATTDRVYVASSFPEGDLAVFTIRGQLVTRLQHLSGQLFLDEAPGRLYVTGWGGLVTVDTSDHSVVGYRRRPTEYAEFTLFDEVHRRFYTTRSNTADIFAFPPQVSDPLRLQTVNQLPSEQIQSLTVAADGTIFVVNDKGAVYKGREAGWELISKMLPPTNHPVLHLAPGTSEVMFAHPGPLEQFSQAFGLFRSADGGRRWTPAVRGLKDFAVRDLALSPDFATDETAFLLSGEDGIFQSADGGDTWQRVSDVTGHHIALASAASDPAVFLMLGRDPDAYNETQVYAPAGDTGAVERVGAIAAGLYGGDALALSPNYTQDGTAIAGFGQAGLFLSQDFGRTWRRLPPRPETFSVHHTIHFSPEFTTDRTVYALLAPSYFGPEDRSGLYRSIDGGETWQRATDADPLMSALAMGPDGALWAGDAQGHVEPLDPAQLTWTVAHEPTPTPVPTPSEPPAGFYRPAGPFADLWTMDPEVRRALGWAAEPGPRQSSTALQPFENGAMIWRADTRTIYVLYNEQSWDVFEDTWTPDEPEWDPSIQPPAGRQQPVRGFGKVWREQPEVRDRLGWALQAEKAYTSLIQDFERGTVISIGDSIYVLTHAAGEPATWLKR